MKASELISDLNNWCTEGGWERDYTNTCDTIKHGDGERELHKVGVTMMPTVALLRKAKEMGLDFLIVHEPLFYNHFDNKDLSDPVAAAKSALLESCPFTLWRFHDHPHSRHSDMIHQGAAEILGLTGTFSGGKQDRILHLDAAILPEELRQRCIMRLGCRYVRLAGDNQTPIRTISFNLGATGLAYEDMLRPEVDAVLTGETCEWRDTEYARDATALGIHKVLYILGHEASERAGMVFLANYLRDRYSDKFQTEYLDCGEPFV